MYKVASDRRQASLHHGKISDWINGDENLSVIDQIKQLQDGTRILQERIDACTDNKERARLGKEKFEVQKQLRALKDKWGFHRSTREGLAQFIVDAAREILTPSQYETIHRAAIRRFDIAQRVQEGA